MERSSSDKSGSGMVVTVTGSSGLVGRRLTELLRERGHTVRHLTRNRRRAASSRETFHWDPARDQIDAGSLQGADAIIHLAGENIARRRWSRRVKKRIAASRAGSTRLLYDTVMKSSSRVNHFITASATGIYGSQITSNIYDEADISEDEGDFLAITCKLWEESADLFRSSGIRSVKIRSGIVVAPRSGFTGKIAPVARLGFVPVMGSGENYLSWIHIDDICNIYLKALEDEEMSGPYNAVFHEHTTQKQFMECYAALLGSQVNTIHIPERLIRLVLGEMSTAVLGGSRISAEKLKSAGYQYLYPTMADALTDIINRRSGK